jgi:toxin YoeB
MSFRIIYTPNAEKDIEILRVAGDKTVLIKLRKLILELKEHPYYGTGKPKRLRGNLAGAYSRRITKKHRLVYEVHDEVITVLILSVEGHYDDK